MTRKEEILKKATEIMNQGEFGSLSDYEVTTHVALETAQWADKTIIEKACKWLKRKAWLYQYCLDGASQIDADELACDFCKAMEE